MTTENDISRKIIRSAIEVHRTLGGPGLLESVYEKALAWELSHAGLQVARQVELPITYKGHGLSSPLRIDLVVGNKVIVDARRLQTTMRCLKRKCLPICACRL